MAAHAVFVAAVRRMNTENKAGASAEGTRTLRKMLDWNHGGVVYVPSNDYVDW